MLIRSLVFLASTLSVWSMPYASDLDEGSTFLQNLKRGTCPSTSAYDAFIHHCQFLFSITFYETIDRMSQSPPTAPVLR